MIFGKIHNFVCIPSTSDNNFSKHFLPLMYKLLLFFPLFAPVQAYVNAFAAKSALSAFPFPGKIHPILPAFLITRTSSGTAQKPGDFFSLPAGTAVRFSSSGRTCLPSICCTQSSCKAFTPRIPTSASAPLWTCRCQKIRSMQFYSSFASLPSAFFLHSLQNRKRTFIISATRGSCQKNCQRDTNRL